MARVLFVDDDPTTLKMLCKVAELAGHQALTARSGAEALEAIPRLAPDLVILDMMMPDMDGLAVLASLRADEVTGAIPVVMLSAGSELDAPERALAAGAQAYLVKPVGMQTLIEVIDEHAGST